MHFLPNPSDWHKIFFGVSPDVYWLEKVIRPVCVYLFLLVIFRIAGKRELGQATLFDFLILLLISNVVQNAIIGNDSSILGSYVGVGTLIVLSFILNYITSRSIPARRVLEGMPTLLVYHGEPVAANLQKEAVSRNDLLTALREQGIASLKEVRYAIMELDGKISVIRTDAAHPEDRDNCVTAAILEQYDTAEMSEFHPETGHAAKPSTA